MNNININMDDHKCNICNKQYSSYKSLWNHNKEFHKNNNTFNGKKSETGLNRSENSLKKF